MVNRGVHHLPPAKVVAEDPLGIATATRRVSDPLRVTVHPRLVSLDSCALYPQLGLRQDWSGQQSLASPGAFEFRGIRPHQPGEPLSHIDWKSTAKTGILMLRETEEPAGAEVTIVLDGTASFLVGEAPDSNFELAVRVAGSVADFALRSGRRVTLVTHEQELRRNTLSPDAGGRIDLLERLAEVRADAPTPVAQTLRHLRAEGVRLLQAQSVTVVSLSLDHQLLRTLLALREEGVHLALVYVAGPSFEQASGDAPLRPFLPPRPAGEAGAAGGPGDPFAETVRRRQASPEQLPPEARSALLSLASAGIPCLTLTRGDDLGRALSSTSERRRREARRG